MFYAVKQAGKLMWQELGLSPADMRGIASAFCAEMKQGLAGGPSSLPMLPAYLGKPGGREEGTYAALDFGGTNVRVLLVRLAEGNYEILRKTTFPLKDAAAGYDLTRAAVDGGELFSFISRKIGELVGTSQRYRLGFTFSFTCEHQGLDKAVLLNWSKEIETSGVEGRDVGMLLREALRREKIDNVSLAAIVNDTTATLLTGAFAERACDMAGILGTGYNVCYTEPNNPWTKEEMIVNIEAGAFAQAPRGRYDLLLDKQSERPGEHLLEKMVSGRYLGELVRLILLDLHQRDLLFRCENLSRFIDKGALPTEELGLVLAHAERNGFLNNVKLGDKWGCLQITEADYAVLRQVCRDVRDRSARLAAAAFAGVLLRIDPQLDRRHLIAVDGSLYEKLPGYAVALKKALGELLGENKEKVSLRLTKDGSGIGAAIAAATSQTLF